MAWGLNSLLPLGCATTSSAECMFKNNNVMSAVYLVKVTDDLVKELDAAQLIGTFHAVVIPENIFCQGGKHHCNCIILLMVQFIMVPASVQKPAS
jgi:hypothetical protein